MVIRTSGTLFPAFLLGLLCICACGSTAGPTGTSTDMDTVAVEPEQEVPSIPGKQYIPTLGVHLPVVDGCTLEVLATEVLYRRTDGTVAYSVNWETDPEGAFQRFVNGITVGDKMVRSNGGTEDLGNNRTAFATFFGDPTTGIAEGYGLNAWEAGHAKGTFACTAYFTVLNEGTIAAAKKELIAFMDGVQHLTPSEEETANAAARKLQQQEQQGRHAAVNTRKRDTGEASLREALTGIALVKLKNTASNSSAGSSSLTSLERFQLCPSGQGSWTYGTDMVIQAERVNDQGDVFDVGSATGTTDNRAVGTWDVERYQGRLLLVIHTYDGQEKSWNIAPGDNEWSYLIGGKVFHVSKPGGTYGPECR